jgi:hypothetical protein
MCEEKHDLKDAEDVDIVEVEGESAAVLECEGATREWDGGRRGGALAEALALAQPLLLVLSARSLQWTVHAACASEKITS